MPSKLDPFKEEIRLLLHDDPHGRACASASCRATSDQPAAQTIFVELRRRCDAAMLKARLQALSGLRLSTARESASSSGE